jgi:hypothetical protein
MPLLPPYAEQVAEEQLGGNVFELQRASLRRLKQIFLVCGRQLSEGFARERFAAMSIHVSDAYAQDLPQRQAALITEFGSGLQKRSLHVPDSTVRVGGLHVSIQKLRHTQLHRTRPDLVGGNQPITNGYNEGPFVSGEKSGLIGFLGGLGDIRTA